MPAAEDRDQGGTPASRPRRRSTDRYLRCSPSGWRGGWRGWVGVCVWGGGGGADSLGALRLPTCRHFHPSSDCRFPPRPLPVMLLQGCVLHTHMVAVPVVSLLMRAVPHPSFVSPTPLCPPHRGPFLQRPGHAHQPHLPHHPSLARPHTNGPASRRGASCTHLPSLAPCVCRRVGRVWRRRRRGWSAGQECRQAGAGAAKQCTGAGQL